MKVLGYNQAWQAFVNSCWVIPRHQICVNCCTHIQSYIHKWHVGLLCKTLYIIQISLNCLILCDFRINWWEVRLNSSWNHFRWFLSMMELDRPIKRVELFKIQPQERRVAKANFICWTLFWRKCWMKVVLFSCLLVLFVCSSLQ